jgi:hypothetical protein
MSKSINWFSEHILKENVVISRKMYDFMCKVANNLDEAVKLVESGFEYVTEMDGVKLFRKRK